MNFCPIFVYRRYTINKVQEVLGQSRNHFVHKGGVTTTIRIDVDTLPKHLNRSRRATDNSKALNAFMTTKLQIDAMLERL
jgi:hypothetical protein